MQKFSTTWSWKEEDCKGVDGRKRTGWNSNNFKRIIMLDFLKTFLKKIKLRCIPGWCHCFGLTAFNLNSFSVAREFVIQTKVQLTAWLQFVIIHSFSITLKKILQCLNINNVMNQTGSGGKKNDFWGQNINLIILVFVEECIFTDRHLDCTHLQWDNLHRHTHAE